MLGNVSVELLLQLKKDCLNQNVNIVEDAERINGVNDRVDDMTYMYEKTKTWNPFKGCGFDCVYCEKSFKAQAKRQKHNCIKCYNYEPHYHPERLKKIPKADLVFCCGNGDISFATFLQQGDILQAIGLKTNQTFLLQTKNPRCLRDWRIPSNVIVGTTIETNRDTKHISKAPSTDMRKFWLDKLNCRKAVTIEPILDFDLEILKQWIWEINPEIVWIGYDNHNCGLVEPELDKTKKLIKKLEKFTDVRLKTIREKMV